MKTVPLLVMFLFFLPYSTLASRFPISFTDAAGRHITLETMPRRVVSLVPSVTEMLLSIGASDVVKGITYHSILPPEASGKPVVGGFFSPDPERVAALEPDIIFCAGLQKEITGKFAGKVTLVDLGAGSIEESFRYITLLGRIFDRQAQAARIVREQKRLLDLIRQKTEPIPAERRLRVMRIMGRDAIMTPGIGAIVSGAEARLKQSVAQETASLEVAR